MITAAINILMWQFLIKTNSVQALVRENGQTNVLIELLERMYDFDDEDQAEQMVL